MSQQTQSTKWLSVIQQSRTALLTTYRRNGEPVGTPVTILLVEGKAYFTTWTTTGKVKRITNNPHVKVAPCTMRGKVIGASVDGIVRRLDGAEAEKIDAIGRRSFGGKLWSLIYHLRGWQKVLFEIEEAAPSDRARDNRSQ